MTLSRHDIKSISNFMQCDNHKKKEKNDLRKIECNKIQTWRIVKRGELVSSTWTYRQANNSVKFESEWKCEKNVSMTA